MSNVQTFPQHSYPASTLPTSQLAISDVAEDFLSLGVAVNRVA